MAHHIADEEERTVWVHDMTLPIQKATLSFVAKFWWSIIQTRLSPTHADNVVTWDRTIMLTTFMAGLEVDFSILL